jgi:hypothetical protein
VAIRPSRGAHCDPLNEREAGRALAGHRLVHRPEFALALLGLGWDKGTSAKQAKSQETDSHSHGDSLLMYSFRMLEISFFVHSIYIILHLQATASRAGFAGAKRRSVLFYAWETRFFAPPVILR